MHITEFPNEIIDYESLWQLSFDVLEPFFFHHRMKKKTSGLQDLTARLKIIVLSEKAKWINAKRGGAAVVFPYS